MGQISVDEDWLDEMETAHETFKRKAIKALANQIAATKALQGFTGKHRNYENEALKLIEETELNETTVKDAQKAIAKKMREL
jgi:hypothetical protein